MSTPLEHDYIGLAENLSLDGISDKISSSSVASTLSSEDGKASSLNFKETELRLGLPGCESPERKSGCGVSFFGGKDLKNKHNVCSPLKSLVAGVGAKRGFSDAIDGSSGKWGFSMNDRSEVDLGKGAALFSPRGGNVGKPSLVGLETQSKTQQQANNANAPTTKEAAKPVQEKNKHVAGTNEHATAPAAK